MSFASGFFNSVDHDRLYDATDISRLFDGLIRDGIFASIGDCFVVKQSNQMNVTVGTGRAWFNHTWSYNDALYPVTIPPSEILMDRIDAIVLEINSVEAVRANSIKLIKGTPSSTPTKPALTNAKEVHQYPLAYVKVGKEVTSIRQADIENCVGTSMCPFVTGILEVISIEQLIPQWKDILNRFVEENTANFNTWMNGEKQDYQAWLAAAKKEIADWEATSKSDYQKWYDSIKNGYDQWFATIKAAYDANWSTFQQWEKSSQAEFDKWFENMKNKLEGDLGAKLTLETEKLGNEKVSLIESTKKDLEGTVEVPLMIGNATRNLLNPTLNTKTINGITCTNNGDGTYTFNGTATSTSEVIFSFLSDAQGKSFYKNTVGKTIKFLNGGLISPPVGRFIFTLRDGNKWWSKGEQWNNSIFTVSEGYSQVVVDLHIYKGQTVTDLTVKPMLTTDFDATNDDFVPYSGYDIKTIGKNIVGNPSSLSSPTIKDGIITFPAKSAAVKDTYLRLYDDVDISAFDTFRVVVESINETINDSNKSYVLIKTRDKKEFSTLSPTSFEQSANKYISEVFNCLDFGNEIEEITIVIKKGYAYPGGSYKISVFNGEDKEFSDWVKYVESSVHIDSSTEFPNFDLKAFDGATHIISPGNVQSFHADAPNGKYLLESIKKSAESGGVSYGASKPTNPKPGDLWINPDESNALYFYTGKYWYTVSTGIYIASNGGFPFSPYVGQLCYNPNSKMMYVYIPFGGSFGGPGWYPIGSEDPGGYHYGASAPTNTKLLWIDTSGVARFYNGSAWAPLAATWG